jgi:phosphate transport system permease protein
MVSLLILALGAVAWATGRAKAVAFAAPGQPRAHSRPNYHGWFVALAAVVPALLFLAIWAAISGPLVDQSALANVDAASLPADASERGNLLAEARALANQEITTPFSPQARDLAPAYEGARSFYNWLGLALALLIAFAAGGWAFTRLSPAFRARTRVERIVMGILLGASLIAILTTVGIIASVLFESIRFFSMVSPAEFLFGLNWSPQIAIRADQAGSSGRVRRDPALLGHDLHRRDHRHDRRHPARLMSAIYLTQYARPAVRKWMKPLLEILAGVPTVVYGYFAALTVAPAIRDFAGLVGIPSSTESALAAGLVMGIMIIPSSPPWPTTACPPCRRRCATAASPWAPPSPKRSRRFSSPPRSRAWSAASCSRSAGRSAKP